MKDIYVRHKKYADMSLWLPPAFESTSASNKYGVAVGEITQQIKNFIDESKAVGVPLDDVMKAAMTMVPMAQHGKAIITASIPTWRDLVTRLSAYDVDPETRYIVLHVCRDLKMRYLGFFSDLALQTQDGKVYGLDTITNDGFWKKSQIVKRQ
jgi:hypothetical protein